MLSGLTTFVFFIYIAAMLFIGYIGYKSTKNYNDYIIGGRTIGPTVTALSAGASDMSGWLLLGLPGAIYASGLGEAWIAVGLTIGAYLNWLFISARLRSYTEVTNSVTLPVFFSNRIGGSHLLRIICSIVIIIFFTVYSASGMVAGARIFEFLLGIEYQYALFFGALATIVYVVIGGYLGVSWTDAVQGTLMLFALIYTPIIVIYFYGGFDETLKQVDIVAATKNIDFNSMSNITFIGFISLMAWGLGYFGQPHILSKFISAKSISSLKHARRIGISWMILTLIGAIAIGYFGIAYFSDPFVENFDLVNKNNERVFIGFTTALFHPIIAGILLSAILSAVMSTLSTQLLLASTSIVEDLYRNYNNNANPKHLLWLGKILVVIISIIAIIIASNQNSSILKLVSDAWAGFGSAFGPLVILSLFYKRLNKSGAISGVIIGALVVILWRDPFLTNLGLSSFKSLYSMVPGFILSFISIIVVSSLTKEPSNTVIDTFEKANTLYKENK